MAAGADDRSVSSAEDLTPQARHELLERVSSARGRARTVLRAQLLLLLDDGHDPVEAARLLHTDLGVLTPTRTELAIGRARRAAFSLWSAGRSLLGRARISGALTDLVVLGLIAVVTMAPIADNLLESRVVVGNNDNEWLVQRASEFELTPFVPPTPHFLFPLLVRLLNLATGGAVLGLVVIVVLVGLRWAAGAAVYAVFRGAFRDGGPEASRPMAIVGAVLALVIESPRILLAGREVGVGDAFVPLQTLWNATGVTVVPLAVLTVALVVDHVDRARTAPVTWYRGAALGALGAAACLAKPSFAVAFLPAIPIWLVWAAKGGVRPRRTVAASVAVWLLAPMAVVTAWQLWWIAQPGRVFADGGASRLVWSPLTLAREWGAERPIMWLALVVPALGLVVGGRAWLRRPKVVLLLIASGVALVQFLLLTESGDRAATGNIGWGAQLAIYLLSIEAIRAVVAWGPRLWRHRSGRLRVVASGAVLAVCATSGIVVIVADGWRTSRCLRGEVTVERLDPDRPGTMIETTECAGI